MMLVSGSLFAQEFSFSCGPTAGCTSSGIWLQSQSNLLNGVQIEVWKPEYQSGGTYFLNEFDLGDIIYVDWNGKTYKTIIKSSSIENSHIFWRLYNFDGGNLPDTGANQKGDWYDPDCTDKNTN